jgi:hypothetical protein
MSPRLLNTLNTTGVFALGVLAVVQWRDNAALRTRVQAADAAAVTAADESAKRGVALAAAKSDLEDFRARLTRADEARRALETEITTLTRRATAAESQIEAYRANLADWQAAVAARDTRLAEYAKELDAARQAHAGAVTRHNTLVTDHNALAARFARLLDALGPDAAPVRLTAEAIPAPTHITEPGQARRALTPGEAAAIVARLVGRQGHTYGTPFVAPAASPAPVLVEGERFRLFTFPDESMRFERADLRVYLPAARP